jgi:DNA-binding ferritin-like protein (Dps family)
MLLHHIEARPSQPSISLNDIREFVDSLSSSKNKEMVNKQQEQLKKAAIV